MTDYPQIPQDFPADRVYHRFTIEAEIKITDRAALEAHLLQDGFNGDGDSILMGLDDSISGPFTGALFEAARHLPGIEIVGASFMPRLLDADGHHYRSEQTPPTPARGNDGKFPAWPSGA